jgi:hypothetical protein
MPPPRTLDRRIGVLERRIPRPAPDPDGVGALLPFLLDSELVFIDRGRCDDAALVELLERAATRRDQGADMAELAALELESECELIDGKPRRVVLHPLHTNRWLDVYDATEGSIE